MTQLLEWDEEKQKFEFIIRAENIDSKQIGQEQLTDILESAWDEALKEVFDTLKGDENEDT